MMTVRSWRSLLGTAAVLVSASLMLSGCSGGTGAIPPVDFGSRPTLSAAIEKYDSMLEEMKSEVSSSFGGVDWTEFQQGATIDVDTPRESAAVVNYSSAAWEANLAVRGDERDEALRVLDRVGSKYGFDDPQIVQESEDHFEVTGTDSLGAHYEFSSGNKTTLAYVTGLHLKE